MVARHPHDLAFGRQPAPGRAGPPAPSLFALDDAELSVEGSGPPSEERSDIGRAPLRGFLFPRAHRGNEASRADAGHPQRVGETPAAQVAKNARVVADALAKIDEPSEETDGPGRLPQEMRLEAPAGRRVRRVEEREERDLFPLRTKPYRPSRTRGFLRRSRRPGRTDPSERRRATARCTGPRDLPPAHAAAARTERTGRESLRRPAGRDAVAAKRSSPSPPPPGTRKTGRRSPALQMHEAPRGRRAGPTGASRESGRRRSLEQVRRLELDAQRVGEGREKIDRRERVSAQLEEVVLDSHLIELEDPRKGARRDRLRLGSRLRGRRVERRTGPSGRGQRLAVDLARRRSAGARRERRRRRAPCTPAASPPARAAGLRFPDRRPSRATTQAVSRVPSAASRPATAASVDARNGQEGGFHLRGLDAMAPDLEARVPAADVDEAAVREHPPEISGAIETHARSSGHREEGRGGRGRVLPVSDRERARDDADLPFAFRGIAIFVEQNDLGPVHRVAERRAARPGSLVAGEPLADHAHLGRPEPDVKHAASRETAPVELEVRGEDRLAAELDDPDPREVFPPVQSRGERPEDARHRVVDRDRFPRQELGKAAQAVARERVGTDRGSGEQGSENVGDGSPEARRGQQRQPVVGPDLEPVGELHHVVEDVSMALHHALGRAGRARREQHVREVVRRHRRGDFREPGARDARRSSRAQTGTPLSGRDADPNASPRRSVSRRAASRTPQDGFGAERPEAAGRAERRSGRLRARRASRQRAEPRRRAAETTGPGAPRSRPARARATRSAAGRELRVGGDAPRLPHRRPVREAPGDLCESAADRLLDLGPIEREDRSPSHPRPSTSRAEARRPRQAPP